MWKKANEPIRNALTLAVGIAGMCLLIAHTGRAKAGMTESLTLCAAVLVPSLFPILILSDLIASCRCPGPLQLLCAVPLRVLFGLSPGSLTPLLLGLTGGYPLAAKAADAAREKGLIGSEDARRLTLFFTCPGLPFSVVAAGEGFFGSRAAGATLFIACAAADATAAFLYNRFFPADGKHVPLPQSPCATPGLIRAVDRATGSIVSVCAWVCAFGTLTAAVGFPADSPVGRWLPLFTEVTAALRQTAEWGNPALAAACLAFGGVCIFCQLLPELRKNGTGASSYLGVRLFCAAAAMGTEHLLLKITAISIPAEARIGPLYLTANSVAGSAALLFLCVVFMSGTADVPPQGHR